jgi:DNA polymerase-4
MDAKLTVGGGLRKMPKEPRAIVHLDLDAFFAAVEVLERPDLAGKPVLVGGSPTGRGVVTSASYPARAFGIRSAMPMYRAVQLCPEAVIVAPRFRAYRDYSQRVMGILHAAANTVEQMSIDEACLDLTNQIEAWEEAAVMAARIQRQVREEVGLSASLGVAANKLAAKVASDRDKPGGLTVVPPGEEAAFLAPLPVRVLWGIGPVTASKLAAMGIETVGQLAQQPESELALLFGRHGGAMARRAQGIDRRPVVTAREVKSVSQERTFDHDISDAQILQTQLKRLSTGVARRLQRKEMAAGTIAIKVRYGDFSTFSRQMRLMAPTDDEHEIYRAALVLWERAWQSGRPVRLLGVGGRDLAEPTGQLSFW